MIIVNPNDVAQAECAIAVLTHSLGPAELAEKDPRRLSSSSTDRLGAHWGAWLGANDTPSVRGQGDLRSSHVTYGPLSDCTHRLRGLVNCREDGAQAKEASPPVSA
jgi:hypothetical protein